MDEAVTNSTRLSEETRRKGHELMVKLRDLQLEGYTWLGACASEMAAALGYESCGELYLDEGFDMRRLINSLAEIEDLVGYMERGVSYWHVERMARLASDGFGCGVNDAINRIWELIDPQAPSFMPSNEEREALRRRSLVSAPMRTSPASRRT